jgi:hypothetical protein
LSKRITRFLPVGLDRVDPRADDPLDLGPGPGRSGGGDLATDEVRPETGRGPEQRVALGHGRSVAGQRPGGDQPAVAGDEPGRRRAAPEAATRRRRAVDLRDDELADRTVVDERVERAQRRLGDLRIVRGR